jgi:hypothetical protein
MRLSAPLVASFLSACCCLGMPPDPAIAPVAPVSASSPVPSFVPAADVDPAYVASFCHTPGPACPLLTEAAGAGPFTGCAAIPSTYLGVMYPVGGIGDGLEVPFFLQVRPTAGGCEASARVLVTESPAEEADVAAVLVALRAGQPAPAGSPAIAYVRTAAPPTGYHPLEPTTGISTALPFSGTMFLRSIGARVLLVGQGDFHYDRPPIITPYMVGELWPVS